jgi:transcription initiation factor IIE alpha subunit
MAQDKSMHKMKMHKMDHMKYSCPMHADATSNKVGKCPKCGMDMTKMKDNKMEKMYCCAKHQTVKSDKPGKCPKCGATLNLSPKEKMKMGVMKMYTCPMHAEVTSKKPGKCSTCGMDMEEKK